MATAAKSKPRESIKASSEKALMSSVEITNFEGLRSLKLNDLTRFVIVSGRNNVGKSALLEALYAFHDRSSPLVPLHAYTNRGVMVTSRDPYEIWAPLFYDFDVNREIEVAVKRGIDREVLEIAFVSGEEARQLSLSVSSSAPPVFEQANQRPAALRLTFRRGTLGKDAEILIWRIVSAQNGQLVNVGAARPSDIPSAMFPVRFQYQPSAVAAAFSRLDAENRADEMIEPLRLLEPRLKSLTTLTNGNGAFVAGDIGISHKIPIYQMGDGAARLLELLVHMALVPGCLLLIDEIGAGVHHSVQREVFRALVTTARKYNCQVVATTHSYEALTNVCEAAKSGFESDLSYVRLSRSADDLKATTYDFEHLSVAIDTNMELR